MEEKNQEQEQKVVPSISFDDNKVVVETFNVPLNINGKETNIKMKRLTAGEKKDIVKANAKIKLVGTQTSGSVDSVGYMISLLARVIVEAPFTVSESGLSNFPDNVLEYLFEEYAANTNIKKKD